MKEDKLIKALRDRVGYEILNLYLKNGSAYFNINMPSQFNSSLFIYGFSIYGINTYHGYIQLSCVAKKEEVELILK